MKNVSNAFKEVIKNGGPFYAYAKFVLADGTQLTMTSQKDFYIDGNTYGQSGSGGFPLGEAISKTIDIGIDNYDDRYSKYDFYKAIITLYTEADLADGTTERIQEGIFTVIDSVTPGEIIEITAYDNMYKSDVNFSSTLSYPATLLSLLQEVCKKCDLSLKTTQFSHRTVTVLQKPENVTARQLIGYIAQIAGGNALIDESGYLIIKEYDLTAIKNLGILSGGNLTDDLTNYVSGGMFGESIETYIEGSQFGSESNLHVLSEFTTDPDVGTDDITITGITTDVKEGNDTTTLLYGSDEYALKIDNPLITDKETTGLKYIGDAVIGITIRPFSGTFLANPTIEFMDNVYVIDRKDNIYQSIVSSNTFTYLGDNTISNDTESPERNGSSYQNNATNIYRKVQEDINKDRTEWEKAVDNLNTELQNASGLYETNEIQPDGSTIYYLHDKKTLAESEVVIKVTSQAIGISTDGGKTYPTGITVDGEAIVSILQSVGINADWITTGTLKVGGTDNKNGEITIFNKDNEQVGIINNEGIALNKANPVQVIGDSNTTTTFGLNIHFNNQDNYSYINFDNNSLFEIYNSGGKFEFTAGSPPAPVFSYTPTTGFSFSGKSLSSIGTVSKGTFNSPTINSPTISGAVVNTSFEILNNSKNDIYSDIDMHNYTIKNAKLNNLVGINGYAPYSGTIPIVTSISATSGGGVSWTTSSIVVKDGIIVSGP